ncbi:hypothetical protein [Armatimonas rosea]|uniref:Uncharacterized protein n=1 Tax=Armatimonas rosea TaxID=685828 RepID=A0A7W9SSW8_ARMRO|nr:hypothetical protein [Armatimonas rosea]MBB6052101.1 hypothetical protein [Armatimonas rosea]
MQLLPEIPTPEELRSVWNEKAWRSYSETELDSVRLPRSLKEFLCWPGIPSALREGVFSEVLRPDLTTTVTILAIEQHQVCSREGYHLGDSLFLEAETGFVYSKQGELFGRDGLYHGIAEGLPQLILYAYLMEEVEATEADGWRTCDTEGAYPPPDTWLEATHGREALLEFLDARIRDSGYFEL